MNNKSLLLLILLMSWNAPLRADSATDIEQRISRITNGVMVQNPNFYYKFDAAPLQERMAHYHTPGVSIAVINQGRVEWARGFGVMEAGQTNPVTDATLFQAASISKPIFALGVMRLVQEGKLNLDRDVDDYLTSWKVPLNGSEQPHVTLRQILGHRAGFTVHGFEGYTRTEPLPNLVEILDGKRPANSPAVTVTLKPGTKFRYSGGGVEVAQQLVLDVLGKTTFPEFMRRNVLEPLGMKHSTYEQPLPGTLEPEAASGHDATGLEIAGHWHIYPEMAAAGLWTTPSDLARAGIDMQRALAGQGGTLLPTATAAEMLKPGLGGAGISFFMSGSGRSIRFGHNGANAGFRSDMVFYENEGLGCVVMANSDDGTGLMQEIERAVAREYNWPDYFPKERTETVVVRPDALDAFVGQYQAEENGVPVLIVHRQNDHLMARLFGQPDARVYPEGAAKFFWKNVDAEVSFERNQSGAATGVVRFNNQDGLSFEKFSDEPFSDHKPLTVADCPPRAGLQGCWRGTLGTGTNRLHVVVRIAERSPGKFAAELDSVDQKALGQVLSVICRPPQVKLVVMHGFGMFVGQIQGNGTALSGNWVQNHGSMPLTFERFEPGG